MAKVIHNLDADSVAFATRTDGERTLVLRNEYETIYLVIRQPHATNEQIDMIASLFVDVFRAGPNEEAA